MSEILHNLTQLPVDQLLQLKAVAPLVSMSESHLRTLIASGRIAGIKLGTTWFTTKAAVDAYLALEHKPGPKPKNQAAMK
jgi:excisionase family DNA binding protein